MANTGTCKGCCVRQTGCDSCERCLPKYLCVNMEITPGPYTELTGCCGESYDLGNASFRIPYDSVDGCSVWQGSGGCPDLATVIDVRVSVERIYDECKTIIESSFLPYPLEFDGILPQDLMSFEVVTPEDDVIFCEISRATMVEFQLAYEKCSPCACTRCLPAKLCAVVNIEGDAYDEGVFESGSVEFDCESNRWSGSVAGYEIVISPKPVEEKICGLDVSITGPRGSSTGEIILESETPSGTMGGTNCLDSTGGQFVQGEVLGNPGPQAFASLIGGSFTLTEGYPDSQSIGTVTITDQSCGDCLLCDTTPPPVVPTVPSDCCKDNPVPVTLHAFVTGCYTASGTLTYGVGGWTGFVGGTDPLVNLMTLQCGSGPDGPEWSITWPFCNFSPTPPVILVCGPIDITINGTGSGCSGCTGNAMSIEIVS